MQEKHTVIPEYYFTVKLSYGYHSHVSLSTDDKGQRKKMITCILKGSGKIHTTYVLGSRF